MLLKFDSEPAGMVLHTPMAKKIQLLGSITASHTWVHLHCLRPPLVPSSAMASVAMSRSSAVRKDADWASLGKKKKKTTPHRIVTPPKMMYRSRHPAIAVSRLSP